MEARLGVFLLLLVTVLQAVAGVSFHGEVADKIPKVVEEQKNGQQCKGVCFYGEAADWILKVIEEQKNAQQCKDNQKVPDHRPTECKDIKSQRGNGIYDVYPKFSTGFKVYCDMETDHGGWTVFQRRIDGKTDFYRDWEAYENGFGNLEAEFWLGNRKLHKLTSQGKYELRVEMSDFDGNKLVAKYSSFFIGNATTKYKLKVGGYSGNAGDSMTYSNGMSFSTKDRDNDKWSLKCAVHRYGAWWYKGCTYANLNGQYLKGGKKSAKGLYWWKWKTTHYSMKSTVMMLRKLN